MTSGGPEAVVEPLELVLGPALGVGFAEFEQAANNSAAAKHAGPTHPDRAGVVAIYLVPLMAGLPSPVTSLPVRQHCCRYGNRVPDRRQPHLIAALGGVVERMLELTTR
jgi:hypothetical protein